jgi:hypothetical protein
MVMRYIYPQIFARITFLIKFYILLYLKFYEALNLISRNDNSFVHSKGTTWNEISLMINPNSTLKREQNPVLKFETSEEASTDHLNCFVQFRHSDSLKSATVGC